MAHVVEATAIETTELGPDPCLEDALAKTRQTVHLDQHHIRTAEEWLEPSLSTAEGTSQVYGLLHHYVQNAKFVETFNAFRVSANGEQTTPAAALQHHRTVTSEVWEYEEVTADQVEPELAHGIPPHSTAVIHEVTDNAGAPAAVAGTEEDQFVLVEKEDIIEAMGTFIAAYLATLPEARNLDPKELQHALATSLKELRKGPVLRLYDWGKYFYKAAAFSYTVFTMFDNPWLVKAVIRGMLTFTRIVVKILL